MRSIELVISISIIALVLAMSGCCCCTTDSSVKDSVYPSAYVKYSANDMTKEQIIADAQEVDWEALTRNPENYDGMLITIQTRVKDSTTSLLSGYAYRCYVNPTDDYSSEIIELYSSEKLENNDRIRIYGVVDGLSGIYKYPIIRGVYLERYV